MAGSQVLAGLDPLLPPPPVVGVPGALRKALVTTC